MLGPVLSMIKHNTDISTAFNISENCRYNGQVLMLGSILTLNSQCILKRNQHEHKNP